MLPSVHHLGMAIGGSRLRESRVASAYDVPLGRIRLERAFCKRFLHAHIPEGYSPVRAR